MGYGGKTAALTSEPDVDVTPGCNEDATQIGQPGGDDRLRAARRIDSHHGTRGRIVHEYAAVSPDRHAR